MLSTECWDLRNRQVAERRNVISTVIDTIKLLGKQGLPGRAHRAERLHSLGRNDVNHGNFLELIKETAKHNQLLRHHLEKKHFHVQREIVER